MEKISWTDRVRNEVKHRHGGQENPTYWKREGRLTGLVTSCIGTAFYNTVLKEGLK
jgi:hypothetical protein